MRLFRPFVAATLLAGIALSTLPARAGTLTWSPPTWANREGTSRKIDLLNRSDCLKDATATFAIPTRNVSANAVLELWAGSNCDTLANRNGSTKTCSQVTDSVTASTARTVVARFQDMIKPFDASGAGTVDTCDQVKTTSLDTRSLYFVVYTSGSSMTEATVTPWVFKYDVTGPAAPTNVTAGPGEGSLMPAFTPPTETNLLHYKFYCSLVGDPPATAPTETGAGGTPSDPAGTAGTGGTDTAGTGGTDTAGTGGTDTTGTAGADPAGTAGADTTGTGGTDTAGTGGTDATGTGGTGATGTSGTDAGGTSGSAGTSGTAGSSTEASADPTCTSAILIPGEDPPKGAIDCGEIGAQGAKGGPTSSVLQNDIRYAVAVATEDTANNVGKLSQLACGTPQEVTGFYEAYRAGGGKAGGGYCSFAPAHNGALASLVALLVVASALVRRRR